MRARLIWLSIGTFLIGAESFLVAGVLPQIAADLHAPLGISGQLVTAYAIAYAIGSPVLAALLGSAPRKAMLVTAIAAFALSNALAAAATTLPMLMLARVLLGLSAGLFIPTANAVAVAIVPPEMRARAVSFVISGMTIAIAVGAPLGTLLAGQLGWRAPFWTVAAVSAIAAIGMIAALRSDLPVGTATLRQRFALAGKPAVLKTLLVTFFWAMSAFSVFTFIAPQLQRVGITGAGISLAFLAFGVASAIGNHFGGVIADRVGTIRTQAISLVTLVLLLIGVSVVVGMGASPAAAVVLVSLLAAWGLAGWLFYPAQSARLVEVAPESPVVALSLNSSALFFGQASGAATAAAAMGIVGVADLAWIGAGCALIALVVLRWAAAQVEAAEKLQTAAG
jgi:predicted MFS family arabinose efflux permease